MRRLFPLILLVAVAAVSARADYPEIDKKSIRASASESFWYIDFSISGEEHSDAVAAYGKDSWARYDLGKRYRLGRFQHQPGYYTDHGRIKEFEIYVTDVLSDERADWGPYAYRGVAANTRDRKTVNLNDAVGRYVIIYVNSVYGTQARFSDVWMYGEPVIFDVTNPATGSARFTNDPTVSVGFNIPKGKAATAYAVTETDEQPTQWLPEPPKSHTFVRPAEEDTPLTLHGWWKDDADTPNILHEKVTIVYTKAAPVARAKDIEAPATLPGYPAVIKPFDVDDGSVDLQGMGVWRQISCPQDQTPDEPFVTLPDFGEYKVTLTVSNSAGNQAEAISTVTVVPSKPAPGDAVWTGGGGSDKRWTLGANWRGGRCPTNPGGVVHFFDAGSDKPENITSLLDCPGNTWTVAGLKAGSNPYSQHIDLNGKKLLVDGEIWLGDMIPAKQMIFTNGAVQFGTPDKPTGVTIAYRSSYNSIGSFGTMVIGNRATKTQLIPYLDELNVGYSPMWVSANTAVLDLRNATLQNDTLRMKTLRVGCRAPGFIQLGEATKLKNIIVEESFNLGVDGGAATGKIGDPDNDYYLPPNVSFTIGKPQQPAIFRFGVPHGYYGQQADARLMAASGGRFEVYASAMNLAASLKGGGPCEAVLDLRHMDEVQIQAESARIGSAELDATMRADVTLPAGVFSANELVLGKTPKGRGRLTLHGTMLRPQSLTIGSKGALEVNIQTESGGLDLAENASLAIENDGKIRITSIAVPETAAMQWGVRWKGDHVAALQELHQAKKLMWESLQLPVTIFQQDGFTYVGLKPGVPRISDFSLTDRTSGSEHIANSRTINARCTIRDGAAAINGYCILDTPDKPQAQAAVWQAKFPKTATIKGGVGQKTFYAWIRDAAGNVCGRSYTIEFAQPLISKEYFSVTAGSEQPGHPAGAAIDGSAEGAAWLAKRGEGSWLMIDLKKPCYLGWMQLDADAAFTVFVTDDPGPDPGNISAEEARKAWGEPIREMRTGERTTFAAPRAGRYVILYQQSTKPAELREIWLGLIPQDTFEWRRIFGSAENAGN